MQMNDKVLLVELSGIHYEVVYSHIKCLKEAGYEVIFVCYEDIEERPELYSAADRAVLLSEPSIRWAKPFQLLRVFCLLQEEDCRNLVLATADSGIWLIRVLLLTLSALPLKLNVVRCIHNFRPLKEKFLENNILNKVFKKVLVLNKYIVENNKDIMDRENLLVESFLPIFFPKEGGKKLTKGDEETWICIPGKVNTDRRDYDELIKQMRVKNIDERLKFILLGGDDGDLKDIKKKIRKNGVSERFVTFGSEFIPQKLMSSYIEKSDFIMPLIHPSKEKYKKYIEYKVSGAFNLAFGFEKPLVCVDDYEGFRDFDSFSIFYSQNSIISTANRLPEIEKDDVIDENYVDRKMSIKSQSEKYKKVIKYYQ